MKWLGESENHHTRHGETKKVRESLLRDRTNHILLPISESLLKVNLKKLTRLQTSTSKLSCL